MKLRAVGAAFRLGVRAPLRSRLVLALLPLLAAAAVALPLHLHSAGGEGEEGALRMALSWPLGAAFAVLAAATLWAGSAAVAGEIERKRFVSDAVSPAGAFSLWCGRWLGLVAIDAALLASVLAAVFCIARLRAPEAARLPVRVPLERDAAYDREIAALLGGGDAELAAAALADMRSGAYMPVSPGEARAWRFKLPRRLPESVRLDFSCLSAYGMAQGVDGALAVRPPVPGSPDLARHLLSKDGDGTFRVEIPGSAFAGLREADVVFENAEDPETGAGALVSHPDSVRLTVPGGGLAGNLVRAGAVLLAALSLLAALGLACGCAFSPPVAAFVATGLALAVVASGSGAWTDGDPGHDHGAKAPPSAAEVALGRVSSGAAAALRGIVAPVRDADALGRVGDGVAVSPRAAVRAVAECGVLFPLLLGLAAACTLSRREFP